MLRNNNWYKLTTIGYLDNVLINYTPYVIYLLEFQVIYQ